MTERFDVVVVGASVAGCTAATLLAQRGLSVALLERHRDPAHYKRACTHYIQSSAMPTIERLGLTDAIMASGGQPNRLETWTRWGWIRPEANGGSSVGGVNVPRAGLDPLLRQRAAAEPTVTLRLGATVTGLRQSRGRCDGVVAEIDGTEHQIEAALTIGADGRHSRVAEAAGLPQRERPHGRFVYFARFRDVDLTADGASRIWMLEPGVAFAFPNRDHTVVSLMLTADKLAEFRRNPLENFLAAIRRLPDGPELTVEQQLEPLSGVMSYGCVRRRSTAPGLALIGDAAMVSDYLWGTGCGFAFQSAEWLTDAVLPAFAGDRTLDSALATYRRRHRATLAGHHLLMTHYASGRPFTIVERLLLSAAARDQQIARHLQRYGERRIGATQFLSPAVLGKAALINAGTREGRRTASAPPVHPSPASTGGSPGLRTLAPTGASPALRTLAPTGASPARRTLAPTGGSPGTATSA